MKKILTSFALVAASLAFAQVGVNNDNPEATLDIKVKDASAVATDVEGVLVPRVTATRAQNMGESVPESTLVYITEGTAVASTTISEVDGKGFYYFDATPKKWIKVGGGNSSTTWGNTKANMKIISGEIVASDFSDDVFTIIGTGPANDITLPNPGGDNKFRVISLRNQSPTQRNFAGDYQPLDNTTLRQKRGMLLQSDGSVWYVIAGF